MYVENWHLQYSFSWHPRSQELGDNLLLFCNRGTGCFGSVWCLKYLSMCLIIQWWLGDCLMLAVGLKTFFGKLKLLSYKLPGVRYLVTCQTRKQKALSLQQCLGSILPSGLSAEYTSHDISIFQYVNDAQLCVYTPILVAIWGSICAFQFASYPRRMFRQY